MDHYDKGYTIVNTDGNEMVTNGVRPGCSGYKPYKKKVNFAVIILSVLLFISVSVNVLTLAIAVSQPAEYVFESMAYDITPVRDNFDHEVEIEYNSDIFDMISYLSTSAVDDIAVNMADAGQIDVYSLVEIHQYMSTSGMDTVVEIMIDNGTIELISELSNLADYLSQSQLNTLAKKLAFN